MVFYHRIRADSQLKDLERGPAAGTVRVGTHTREADSAGRDPGKFLGPERRSAIERAREEYGLPERLACRLLGQWRGTRRYTPILPSDDDVLTGAIITPASQYGRHGYRRSTALLQQEAYRAAMDQARQ
jgi:hypothetical protein